MRCAVTRFGDLARTAIGGRRNVRDLEPPRQLACRALLPLVRPSRKLAPDSRACASAQTSSPGRSVTGDGALPKPFRNLFNRRPRGSRSPEWQEFDVAVTKQPKPWLPVGVVSAGVDLVLSVAPVAMAATGTDGDSGSTAAADQASTGSTGGTKTEGSSTEGESSGTKPGLGWRQDRGRQDPPTPTPTPPLVLVAATRTGTRATPLPRPTASASPTATETATATETETEEASPTVETSVETAPRLSRPSPVPRRKRGQDHRRSRRPPSPRRSRPRQWPRALPRPSSATTPRPTRRPEPRHRPPRRWPSCRRRPRRDDRADRRVRYRCRCCDDVHDDRGRQQPDLDRQQWESVQSARVHGVRGLDAGPATNVRGFRRCHPAAPSTSANRR